MEGGGEVCVCVREGRLSVCVCVCVIVCERGCCNVCVCV